MARLRLSHPRGGPAAVREGLVGDAMRTGNSERRVVTRFMIASVLLVGALTRSSMLCGAELTGPRTPGVTDALASSYDVVLARVRTEPLIDLNDPKLTPVLLGGTRVGGVVKYDVGFHNPLDPHILERDFANWNIAARASLLLSFARLVTESGKPIPYLGLSEAERRRRVSRDAEERVRIKQIVTSGGYAASWKPFATAYRKLRRRADKVIPPDDETPNAAILATVRIARELGMFRLIRELPIDSVDVTNEIFRVLHEDRADAGMDDESDGRQNAFYMCGPPPRVHIFGWHKLAHAFYRAWDASDKKEADAQALLIVAMFEGISKDAIAWAVTNHEVGTATANRRLNDLAESRGLLNLLEKYAEGDGPSQSVVTKSKDD